MIGKSKGQWIVLTVAHPYTGDRVRGQQVYINRRWRSATRFAMDTQHDLAILKFRKGGNVQCVDIGNTTPKANDQVSLYSYIGGVRGRRQQTTLKIDTSWIRTPAQAGESGGAIVKDNRLIGILSASDHRVESKMVPLSSIRSFLTSRFGSIPPCKTSLTIPPPPPIDNDLNKDQDRRSAITELRKRIAALENREWKTGLKGLKGDKGAKGEKGDTGEKGGEANLAEAMQLIESLSTRLTALADKPLTVEWYNEKIGKVTATVQKRLGETLRIKFQPK